MLYSIHLPILWSTVGIESFDPADPALDLTIVSVCLLVIEVMIFSVKMT